MKVIVEITNHSFTSEPNLIQFYRHPHDIEIKSYDLGYDGGGWQYMAYTSGLVRKSVRNLGKALPEVYRLEPDQQTSLDCDWQKLWKDLNPMLSKRTWSTLLGNALAWTNRTGFPGRHDCINNTDIDSPFPAFDAPRVCGGAILKGVEQGDYLLIESLLKDNRVPSAREVLSKRWLWFYGTSINPEGQVNLIMKPGIDGTYYPVRVPLITKNPVKLKLNTLHKLPIGFIPMDARWLPIP
jgi:hypothetical protein